ncbi:MAG: MFS transporter [Lentisphaeria bacterium]|nr:MFS transporter [Lentisphaeria bacterium]
MIEVNWKKNLFFIWLSQFLALAGFGMCMPFIPLFMREVLQVEESMRGVYVSAFSFAGMTSLCIATAFWGIVADKFGRKLMLLRASYGAALLYPLLAFAPNVYTLILIRFCCSFFSGTVNPAQTLLVSTTPQEKQGFVLGALSTATWSGNMLGYFLGGILVNYFGYRTAFLSSGALYLTGAFLVQFFVRDNFLRPPKSEKPKKPPLKELLTPYVGLILVMFMILGLSRRIDQPFIAMLVEVVNGLDKAAYWTGIASMCAAAGGVAAGMLFGWASDHYPLPKLLITVILLTAAASFLQAYSTNILCLMAARFLAYFAGGGMQPLLIMWLGKVTDPAKKGTFFGWSASANIFGGIVSTLISGTVILSCGVRGVFTAGGVLALLMLPLVLIGIRFSPKNVKL